MEKEVWKPLYYKDCDLSDKYLVSNNGKIYSKKSNKIMKQTLNKGTGYFGFCINIGNRKNKKYIKTHIAVAFNFVDGYREGLVVNHKDGNKQNNNSENLEWITNAENIQHAAKNGLLKPSNCENHYHSKFSNEKVNEIRKIYKSGTVMIKELAEKYGVAQSTMSDLVNGKTYKF